MLSRYLIRLLKRKFRDDWLKSTIKEVILICILLSLTKTHFSWPFKSIKKELIRYSLLSIRLPSIRSI